MEVNIRQFMSSDIERIKEIENSSIRYLTPLSLLQRYYEITPEGFLVAEVDGRIVAYVVGNTHLSQKGLEGHILSIAVDPAYKKRGVGTLMLNHIIDVFKKKGVDKVVVEVKTHNLDARKFYSRLGFKEAYIARGYYRMRSYTEDAAILFKNID